MEKSILNIFNLQGIGLYFLDSKDYEREVVLEVKDESPALYPSCQRRTESRSKRGKWRRISHGFGLERRVYLLVRKEQYFCSSCGKLFTKKMQLMRSWQRRTLEAEVQILESLRGQSFKSLAQKQGISYGVSKRVLNGRLEPGKLI